MPCYYNDNEMGVHKARVVEMISAYKIVIIDPGLRDLAIDVMIILKSIFNK
jgi:hypothetical protein